MHIGRPALQPTAKPLVTENTPTEIYQLSASNQWKEKSIEKMGWGFKKRPLVFKWMSLHVNVLVVIATDSSSGEWLTVPVLVIYGQPYWWRA